MLLCCHYVPEFRKELGELLELSRKLIRWDVLNQPAEMTTLCGLTADQIRKRSHRPQEYYNTPHFMPQPEDSLEILYLNRLRCRVRMTELAACDAFSDREGNCLRPDILQALNRMSSMVYLLMICKKGAIKQ